ncbi:MAG: PAS domain S-box protein, partial [Anaerolineae bacterium]|nr:PAS domain S-box protein [Anaerolineae bacterium]
MTIRTKVLLIIFICFLTLSILSYVTYLWFISHNVIILESENVKDDIFRILTIINDDIAELNAILEDWALWDDTYEFIVTKNQYYIDSNLPNVTLTNLRIEFMVFLDKANRVVYAKRVTAAGSEAPIPGTWTNLWQPGSPLLDLNDPTGRVGGIVLLREGPFLIASRPIATSTGEGPIRGTLIMGRRLDDAEVARLARKAGLSLRVFPFDAENVPADVAQARAGWPNGETVRVIPRSESLISGYAVVNDIYGHPALIVCTDAPREAWAQARLSLRALMLAVFGTGLGMALITLALLEGTILQRLTRLGRAIGGITEHGSVSSRVPIGIDDEWGSLERGVNAMLASLEQAQSHLQVSEERYRYISELISDYAYAFRVEEGNRLVREWVTDSFTRVTGYTLQEMDAIGGWRGIIHPDDMPIALDRAKRLLAGQTDVSEFRIVRKDGEVRWLRDHGRPIWDERAGRVVRIYGAAQDITELRRAEEQLRLQAAALEAAVDAVIITDRDGIIRWVNSAFTAMSGYTAAEAIGQNARLLKSGLYDRAHYARMWEHILAGRVWRSEMVNRRKDGTLYEIEQVITPVYDARGAITHFVAIQRDIAERKRAEAALRASEERYRSLFETVPEIVYALAPDGRFSLLNPAFTRITGRPVEDWLGRPFLDLIHPDDRELARAEFQRALRDETREFRPLRVLNAAGETLILEVLGVAQKQDGRIVGVTGFAHDVTRRVQAEEATRRHVREMEAVHRVSTALRAARTLDDALGILLDETLDLLDSEAGVIRLYHPAAHELRAAVVRGWFAEVGHLALRPGEGIMGRVFIEGRPYVMDDIAADPLLLPAFRANTPAGWRGVAVPIRSATTVEG